jgi:uncharacterized protein YyaL (SSP411 family)
VHGLLRLSELSGEDRYAEVARRVLETHAHVLERVPEAFPTLSRAALLAERGGSVAVVVGSGGAALALAERARRVLGPEDAVVVCAPGERPGGVDPAWLAGRDPQDGKATAYVCRGRTCSLPITESAELSPLAADAEPLSREER